MIERVLLIFDVYKRRRSYSRNHNTCTKRLYRLQITKKKQKMEKIKKKNE